MRKAETLLLGEVFQTFDSFSQSLLSLDPTQGLKLGAFSRLWRKLVFLSDRTIEILIYLVSPFFEGLLNDRILRVVSLAWLFFFSILRAVCLCWVIARHSITSSASVDASSSDGAYSMIGATSAKRLTEKRSSSLAFSTFDSIVPTYGSYSNRDSFTPGPSSTDNCTPL